MIKTIVFLIVAMLMVIVSGQIVCGQTKAYSIDVTVPGPPPVTGRLKMGGSDPAGDRIDVNSDYITEGGIPVIPVTGEFHFSRYPEAYWEESIRKIKAGGINTVATYVFWNMHEEHEGVFTWTGNRDVRRFVELCRKNKLKVIMRIGPFCHGEIRNGGLPDWLLGKPLSIRSDDSLYLFYVRRLYNEIGKQLKGLYFKDGGPIIAVQIENEYQHSASPWGLTYPGQPYDLTVATRDLGSVHEGVSVAQSRNQYADVGNKHMRTLLRLAKAAGIDVPIYTATGWGYAAGVPFETLPVTAAYCYPTWTAKKELSPFYRYADLHHKPDYSPVRYDPADYPVFAAELGAGIMSTYSRRPVVPAESVDALVNRVLGSGANGIGYYMYHGGSTPKGDFYFNDEAYGYPKISYDFQAPVGEYGDIRPSFHRLKLLHFFINDFAALLAPMRTVLPANGDSIPPGDIHELRYAVREKDGSGFLFLNDFQDDTIMDAQKDVAVTIKTRTGEIRVPQTGGFSLESGENAIFPFNFDMGGAKLRYVTAQLLMKGDDPAAPYYVFFVPRGVRPEFAFEKGTTVVAGLNSKVSRDRTGVRISCAETGVSNFTLHAGGRTIRVLVMDKKTALDSYIASIGDKKRLILSDALCLGSDDGLTFYAEGVNKYRFGVFPALADKPAVSSGAIARAVAGDEGLFSQYEVTLPEDTITAGSRVKGNNRLEVTLPSGLPAGVNDLFVRIDYIGDNGMGFLGGNLVTDEFYKGVPWSIGLKRFISNHPGATLQFYFRPLYRHAPFLVDLDPAAVPDFRKDPRPVSVKDVIIVPEYISTVTFNYDHVE